MNSFTVTTQALKAISCLCVAQRTSYFLTGKINRSALLETNFPFQYFFIAWLSINLEVCESQKISHTLFYHKTNKRVRLWTKFLMELVDKTP